MDPKGKGIMINDEENEILNVDEPKGHKITDSGSNNKRKDGKKKRRIKKNIYDSDTSSSSPRDDDDEDSSSKKRLIKTIILITLVSLTIQMHNCCLFHLENPLTLMEKTILFGVIKCVVIYFLSILVFGK
jgi:hypothetical protein